MLYERVLYANLGGTAEVKAFVLCLGQRLFLFSEKWQITPMK
jgi:hypothetical protein